eukprot:TRINITY_DN5101_c0_g1_i1.p1 TRINITY_DN5101_c0_g1~~TRINITY_DN5101_c0_g1_i1.p1  ORF type:complete len:294 (-),score=122.64 TRINITY_DN5101_c0_g1_i1:83-964(-)
MTTVLKIPTTRIIIMQLLRLPLLKKRKRSTESSNSNDSIPKRQNTSKDQSAPLSTGLDDQGEINNQPYWDLRLSQLVEFKNTHHHCRVPSTYDPNPQLGRWVQQIRQRRKKLGLLPHIEKQLVDVGFEWTMRQRNKGIKVVVWDERWGILKKIKESMGKDFEWRKEGSGGWNGWNNVALEKSLKNWVYNQRGAWKRGEMSLERIEKMKELGFDFDEKKEKIGKKDKDKDKDKDKERVEPEEGKEEENEEEGKEEKEEKEEDKEEKEERQKREKAEEYRRLKERLMQLEAEGIK